MLVPYEKYGKSNPEYYTTNKYGKRGITAKNAQLCYSNPTVRKLAKENLLKWIAKYPQAVYFSLGHTDSGNWCACKKCIAKGSPSERNIKFINMLAAETIKKYPTKKLVALAYTPYTEAPPTTVKPAKNVVILFCPYAWGGAKSQTNPITHERNKVSFKHLKQWLKILEPGQMIMFDYVAPLFYQTVSRCDA